MPLQYVKANGLLVSMSLIDLLELTTEDVNAIEAVAEDVQEALDFIDGVSDATTEDLTEAQRHIAFVIEERLLRAEARVNSHAGKRYDLPLVDADGNAPTEIVDVVLSVGRYRLYGRRPVVPDDVRADYEQAEKWLADLSRGDVVVNLGSAASGSEVTSRSRFGLSDRTSVSFTSPAF